MHDYSGAVGVRQALRDCRFASRGPDRRLYRPTRLHRPYSDSIQMPTPRLAGLDLLRVGAAISLMACHAGFWLAPFAIPDTTWLFLGHAGIEAFLVLSGFLAACAMLRAGPQASPLRHGLHVFLRLWPLYAVFVLLNLAFVGHFAVPRPSLPAYLALLQNLAWPHPAFFAEAWVVPVWLMTGVLLAFIAPRLRGASSATGLVLIGMLLAIAHLPRVIAVWLGDPSFDLGLRKQVLMRLDVPLYGLLAAWCWTRQRALLSRWRGVLAISGMLLLAASARVHLAVPLDASRAARIGLLTMCDVAWMCLLPWASTLQLPARFARLLATLASCAYAGLLSHMTLLRALAWAGVPLVAATPAHGLAWLSGYLVLASLVALLIRRGLDRPWRQWLDRRSGACAQHLPPVAER